LGIYIVTFWTRRMYTFRQTYLFLYGSLEVCLCTVCVNTINIIIHSERHFRYCSRWIGCGCRGGYVMLRCLYVLCASRLGWTDLIRTSVPASFTKGGVRCVCQIVVRGHHFSRAFFSRIIYTYMDNDSPSLFLRQLNTFFDNAVGICKSDFWNIWIYLTTMS